MAPSINNSKRKTILPLHIDTASFTNQQSNGGFSFWRRLNNKRQLPIFVLLTFLFFSLFLNLIQHHSASKKAVFPITASKYNALPPPPLSDKSSRAIVVAGHAIYHGPLIVSELSSDVNWVLESFQKGGQVNTFVQHIQKGIDILKEDPKAVLIFSGGETRPAAGPKSEAVSYWNIAQLLIKEQYPEQADELQSRMVTEEYAKDSHENVLFSLCRFSEMTAKYPTMVTVIGFEFKRKRFQDIHRLALRYPEDNFEYIGIDPKEDGHDEEREQGEQENSFKPFQKDLYGCHGSLQQKKILRNPFRHRHPYHLSCPILAPLLNYCPSDNSIYSGPLPWDSSA